MYNERVLIVTLVIVQRIIHMKLSFLRFSNKSFLLILNEKTKTKKTDTAKINKGKIT